MDTYYIAVIAAMLIGIAVGNLYWLLCLERRQVKILEKDALYLNRVIRERERKIRSLRASLFSAEFQRRAVEEEMQECRVKYAKQSDLVDDMQDEMNGLRLDRASTEYGLMHWLTLYRAEIVINSDLKEKLEEMLCSE